MPEWGSAHVTGSKPREEIFDQATWTITTLDLIGTVGGNRYGWFDFNQFSTLAFDNASLNAVPEPASLTLAGMGFLGCVGLAVRRRSGQRKVRGASALLDC